MKTKEELGEAITGYKEIIFGSDTPGCVACLDQLRKRQVIDQKKWENRWGVGSWTWFHVLERQILRVDFIAFVDH